MNVTPSGTVDNRPRYLTVGQAAQFLGVSPWTLRNWDKAGRLKPLRHPKNGYRIYQREQLDTILGSGNGGGGDVPTNPGDRLAPEVQWDQKDDIGHVVQFYESDAYLMDCVAAFVAPAIATDQGGVLIVTKAHRRGIEKRLKARGVDVAGAIARGRLVLLDAGETLSKFIVDLSPDPARFAQVVGKTVAALSEGGRRPRAFGEMVALLWADGKRAAAIRLEELWNDLRRVHEFSLLCAYPMRLFGDRSPSGGMGDVCGCHSLVLPAESYAALPSSSDRLRAITLLQQKAAALEAEVAHREEVENALSEREREMRDFLECAAVGLHQVAPDGTILWANKAELELLGYRAEEYVGRNIAEFHVDRHVIEDVLARLLRGETLNNQPARLRCRDGSIKHVRIHSNAKFDEDGKPVYTRCFTRDVTGEERASASLAAIVESSDDAIVSKSLDGTIRSWNKAAERLFGYTEQEAVGKSITIIIPPERLEEERMIISRLSRGEYVSHYETVRRRKDGGAVEVSISVAPLRDSSGAIIGASKIARDISERRRMDDELRAAKAAAEHANKSKDEFLAVLSHELRTPLTPVLVSVAMMEAEPGLPPRLREDLTMIRRNIALETRLIDDLLDLSRVANGKMALHKERLSLHPLIRNVVEMLTADAQAASLSVEVDLSARADVVLGDSARLHQVLWNLLKNSIKFTPEEGRVTVRTRDDAGGRLVIEVEDTGIGIDPDALPTIFDAFEQGGQAVARRFGGLGLGLAIARRVIELHEGQIVAHSEGPGKGALFTVELPVTRTREDVTPPAPTASEQATGALNVGAGAGPIRILLVEDHADTLKLLRRLLEASGHHVAVAGNVTEAVRAAEAAHRLDLVISDIGLPDGTGLDVMRRVRLIHPELRGIALTGFGMEQDVRNSELAGFTTHLTKPIDVRRLRGMIGNLAQSIPSGRNGS